MPDKLLELLLPIAGFLISGLLGINIFFIRSFMIRIETGIGSLTKAVAEHSISMASFNEKIHQLDKSVGELRGRRANGRIKEHSPQ